MDRLHLAVLVRLDTLRKASLWRSGFGRMGKVRQVLAVKALLGMDWTGTPRKGGCGRVSIGQGSDWQRG